MIRKSILLTALATVLVFLMNATAQQMGGQAGRMPGRMMGSLPQEITSDSNPITMDRSEPVLRPTTFL
jgi:hypothetical protein